MTESRHNGFFRVNYRPDIFSQRPEVGVVGGKLLDEHHRIIGGMMDESGRVEFLGMHEMESGPSYEGHVMKHTDDLKTMSLEFCRQVRQQGYLVVWDPEMTKICDQK